MKAVRLSPVDHIFTGPGAYPIQFLLQYSNHLDSDALYKGLRSITPLFWPVAGYLRKSGDQTYEVAWNGTTPNLEVVDCRDHTFPSALDAKRLLALTTAIDSNIGKSLSNFSLYHFDKGSALVANISHCIVDGYSFFYFLSQWAARVRTGPILFLTNRVLASPNHKRRLLVPEDLGTEKPQYTDQEVFKKIGISYSPKSREQHIGDYVWRFINFRNKEIKTYWDQANTQSPTTTSISSDDIISALIVKRFFVEGWFLTGPARVSTAFDYRKVLPNLGPRYFGNAVRAASFEVDVEQIEKMTVVDIARQVRRAKRSINIENSLESLRYLERARLDRCGGLKFLQRMRVVDEARGLLLTNLSRVSTAQFDFGSGPPTQLIPLTPAERTAVITSQEDGYSVRVSPPTGSFARSRRNDFCE